MNQAQVGEHAFKLAVLFLQLFHFPEFIYFQATILLAPFVECNCANPQLAADLFRPARPFSCSAIALTICVSVNFVFFIIAH
jgi:hypothetical protein